MCFRPFGSDLPCLCIIARPQVDCVPPLLSVSQTTALPQTTIGIELARSEHSRFPILHDREFASIVAT